MSVYLLVAITGGFVDGMRTHDLCPLGNPAPYTLPVTMFTSHTALHVVSQIESKFLFRLLGGLPVGFML